MSPHFNLNADFGIDHFSNEKDFADKSFLIKMQACSTRVNIHTRRVDI